MKKENGITLVSLIITIVLMFIIAGTTVYTSMDRFEINKLKKMYNDIELLSDKVASYYLKYNVLPVVLSDEQQPVEYTYTTLSFAQEGETYYIIDLEVLEGISLNYGKAGFENPNGSDDVYIINEKTHQIYYAKGIEMKGTFYYTSENKNILEDNIPPTKPEIKVISGTVNSDGIYTSDVELEIVPGKDNWSGLKEIHMQLKQYGSVVVDDQVYTSTSDFTIASDGEYEVIAWNVDNNNNNSEKVSYSLTIKKASELRSPTIEIASGTQDSEGIYTTDVVVKLIPGDWYGFSKIHMQLKQYGSVVVDDQVYTSTSNFTIASDGEYEVIAWNEDMNGDISEQVTYSITINKQE